MPQRDTNLLGPPPPNREEGPTKQRLIFQGPSHTEEAAAATTEYIYHDDFRCPYTVIVFKIICGVSLSSSLYQFQEPIAKNVKDLTFLMILSIYLQKCKRFDFSHDIIQYLFAATYLGQSLQHAQPYFQIGEPANHQKRAR